MPTISVIIPTHNVSLYVENCIDSVLNSTWKKLEVIIIDDSSTDDTLKKIQRKIIAINDERCHVLSLENWGGVSHARNVALQAACGDYIAFVDADDWVEATMLEKLLEAAHKYNADITLCGTSRLPNPLFTLNRVQPLVFIGRERIDQYIQMFMLKGKAEFKPYFSIGQPYGTLYKSELLKKNCITFIEGMQYKEDVLFNMYAAQFATCVVRINENMYHVNKNNPHSLTTFMLKDEMLCHIRKDVEERKLFHQKYRMGDSLFEHGLYQYICRSFMKTVVKTCVYDYDYEKCLSIFMQSTYQEAFAKVKLQYMTFLEKIAVTLIRKFHGLRVYYAVSRIFLRIKAIKARCYNEIFINKFCTVLIRQNGYQNGQQSGSTRGTNRRQDNHL